MCLRMKSEDGKLSYKLKFCVLTLKYVELKESCERENVVAEGRI